MLGSGFFTFGSTGLFFFLASMKEIGAETMYSNSYSSYKSSGGGGGGHKSAGVGSSVRSLSASRYGGAGGGSFRSSSIAPYTGSSSLSSYAGYTPLSSYSTSSSSYGVGGHSTLSALSLSASPSASRYAGYGGYKSTPASAYSPSSSASSSPRLSASYHAGGHQSLASFRSNRGSDYGSWSVMSRSSFLPKPKALPTASSVNRATTKVLLLLLWLSGNH